MRKVRKRLEQAMGYSMSVQIRDAMEKKPWHYGIRGLELPLVARMASEVPHIEVYQTG